MKTLKTVCAAFLASALLLSLAPALAGGDIYNKVTRLHILANSDSEEDQRVKLAVRDAVLADERCAAYREVCPGFLKSVEAAADRALDAIGAGYSARAVYSREYFSSRNCDGLSLPAGEYPAVKLILGDGAGRNWWCVLFPSLCRGACEEELVRAGLSRGDIALIRKDGKSAVVRFKLLELFGKLRQKNFFGNK